MRLAFAASIAMHAAIVGWALISINFSKPLPTIETPPVAVNFEEVSEFDDLRAGSEKSKLKEAKASPAPEKPKVEKKPEPKPEPPKQTAAVEPPKPEPEPEKKPEPKPEAKAEPEPEKAPAPKPEPKPEPKKVEAPKPKPKPKVAEKPKTPPKPKFDPDNISALLNKLPDSKPTMAPNKSKAEPVKTAAKSEPAIGSSNPTGTELTISETAALSSAIRRQLSANWRPPTGGADSNELSVRVTFSLAPDGSVVGAPRVLNQVNSPFFLAAADSAIRAVWETSPFSLPPDRYEHWKDITINFNPREMFGG